MQLSAEISPAYWAWMGLSVDGPAAYRSALVYTVDSLITSLPA